MFAVEVLQRMAQPADVVRAHFADVDHHGRHPVHATESELLWAYHTNAALIRINHMLRD